MTRERADLLRRRRWVFALLAVYMALVFALSHQSQPSVPRYLELLSDKVLHAVEYFPLGFLWALALSPAGTSRALLGWGVATLFGATDEFHQAFVPGREASVLDLLADSVGAGVGACAALLWAASRRRSAPLKSCRQDADPLA